MNETVQGQFVPVQFHSGRGEYKWRTPVHYVTMNYSSLCEVSPVYLAPRAPSLHCESAGMSAVRAPFREGMPGEGLKNGASTLVLGDAKKIGAQRAVEVIRVFAIRLAELSYNDDNLQKYDNAEAEKVCADIATKLSVSIELSWTGGGTVMVVLGGPKKATQQSRAMLLQQLQAQLTISASIGADQILFFANDEGRQRMKDLEALTDTSVSISPTQGLDAGVMTIRGTSHAVQRARHEALILFCERTGGAVVRLPIPSAYHAFIAGQNGAFLRDLVERTGAEVCIPSTTLRSSEVVVYASSDDVTQRAAEEILQIYQDKKKSCIELFIQVSKSLHRHLSGAFIRDVFARTGVSLQVPNDFVSKTLKFVGHSGRLEAALQLVYDKVHSLVSQHADVTSSLHKYILQSKAKPLLQVLSVHPDVDFLITEGNCRILITGELQSVEAAVLSLQSVLDELNSNLSSAEPKVEPNRFKHIHCPRKLNGDQDNGADGAITHAHQSVEACKQNAVNQKLFDSDNQQDNVSSSTSVTAVRTSSVSPWTGSQTKALVVECSDTDCIVQSVNVQPDVTRQLVQSSSVQYPDLVDQSCTPSAFNENARVTVECSIHHKHHSALLGLRGQNIYKISRGHSVFIRFPDRPLAGTVGSQFTDNEVSSGEQSEQSDPDPSSLIKISGRRRDCEAAKAALLALVPIKVDLIIPHEFHRHIIGAKGREIRQVMADCQVSIHVPPCELSSDVITVVGAPPGVERAREELRQKIVRLVEQRTQRELRSFCLELTVDAKHHSKLIGRCGVDVNRLKEKHGVQIDFSKRGSYPPDLVCIRGVEENARAAGMEISLLVEELEKLHREEVLIDARTHSRLIGFKGQLVHRIMLDYKVEVKFPGRSSATPDVVVIIGEREHVSECREHLLHLGEICLQDIENAEALKDSSFCRSSFTDRRTSFASREASPYLRT